MKQNALFNFDLLFGDHMNKCSDQARLYYVKLMFFANNGFVANPISVLDSMGYDKSVYQELLDNGELLKLPDRCEVFITSYFVHNHFKPLSWMSTPFAIYWKGKLWIKKNGVATFKPQSDDKPMAKESIARQMFPEDYDKDGNLIVEEEPSADDIIKETEELLNGKKFSDLEPDQQQKLLKDIEITNDDLPF